MMISSCFGFLRQKSKSDSTRKFSSCRPCVPFLAQRERERVDSTRLDSTRLDESRQLNHTLKHFLIFSKGARITFLSFPHHHRPTLLSSTKLLSQSLPRTSSRHLLFASIVSTNPNTSSRPSTGLYSACSFSRPETTTSVIPSTSLLTTERPACNRFFF